MKPIEILLFAVLFEVDVLPALNDIIAYTLLTFKV